MTFEPGLPLGRLAFTCKWISKGRKAAKAIDAAKDLGRLEVVGEGLYKSSAGILYGMGPKGQHRLRHVMQHGLPDVTGKKAHTIFVGGRAELLATVDEAWLKRGAAAANDPGKFVVPMGRSVGTAGERNVTIIVEPGTSNIVTAFPS